MLKNTVTDYVSVTLNSDLVPEVKIVCGTDCAFTEKTVVYSHLIQEL